MSSPTFDPYDPPTITIEPPPIPEIVVDPPDSGTVHVVPVPGPQGPPGGVGASAYVYTTSNPATLHQIVHGLLFKPAGITCLDADGAQLLNFGVAHPAPGITEITFGVPVTPTIYLS